MEIGGGLVELRKDKVGHKLNKVHYVKRIIPKKMMVMLIFFEEKVLNL